MRICMAGACGRMGRRILELAALADDIEIGGAFDLPSKEGTEIIVGDNSSRTQKIVVSGNVESQVGASDVLIDFTLAHACLDNVQAACDANIPAVVGTTGLSEEDLARLRDCAKKIPIVFAPNFSVGINLLFKLVSEAASVLGLDYNCEIIEAHHNQKQDSPSGTAVRLAERAAEALGLEYRNDTVHGREGLVGERPQRQIGMHSVRGGDIAGDHTVAFIGQGERIELVHRAHNRDNFARGALIAARFAVNASPGLYDMQDVLGLK